MELAGVIEKVRLGAVVRKTSKTLLLVWRLAGGHNRQAIAPNPESYWYAWRLAVMFVAPDDTCKVRGFKGAWRLAT